MRPTLLGPEPGRDRRDDQQRDDEDEPHDLQSDHRDDKDGGIIDQVDPRDRLYPAAVA
jgi:hypothetical protein